MSERPSDRFLQCGQRRLDLARTRVMGVLNVTPDSFSDGGTYMSDGVPDLARIHERAVAMIEAGAAVLDVGGESTRPGSDPVTAKIELERVMPVVEGLLKLDTIVSVDTRKPEVAQAVLAAGCHMINDVSGLSNAGMRAVLAESDAAICIMHMRGEPRTMQHEPCYEDVVAEVREALRQRVDEAERAGIDHRRLCIDPGFGFGKTPAHNLALLKSLEALRIDDLPMLVGLSRKRTIGSITGRPVASRLAGSLAAAIIAAQGGADVVRVHDVAETVDALKILEAVES
ncbi:MAG: dihydropteroate synthase [Gammaproteobacteria bacterium]|jgi:dihydropteroate synthase